MGRDGLFTADGSNSFRGGSLHVDLPLFDPEAFRQFFLHRGDVLSQSRGLRYDRSVHIDDLIALPSGLKGDFIEKNPTFDAFEPRIGVREQTPQVSLPCGPENGITDGVNQNIGIGVPL